jgi:hypothetical protein
MTLWIVVGIIVVVVLFVVSRIAPSGKARLADIPTLFAKTQSATKDPSYAQLAFLPPGGKSNDDDSVNLQFSREEGRMGFEWSLLPPRGVRDREKFIQFAESRGQHPVALEAKNGYKCLRVEDGDLVDLMETVLRELYAVTPETTMEFVYDGFTWP